jgi:aspartate racemase
MVFDPALLSPGQRYVPGILGGLGPLAHVEFERRLLARSHLRGARGDCEHPVWLLANAASTPERTRALLEGGESPLRHLTAFAQLLERAGADALFVPCNTAHAYHAEVQRALRIPWVHLMEVVAEAIRAAHPAGTLVGLLATDGTLATGLYHRALEARGLVPVAPALGSPTQARVRSATSDPETGIKATGDAVSRTAREHLAAAAGWCVEHGARVVVPACTEVSVGLTAEAFDAAPLVDPLTVAAEVALDIAYGRRDPAEFFVSRQKAQRPPPTADG